MGAVVALLVDNFIPIGHILGITFVAICPASPECNRDSIRTSITITNGMDRWPGRLDGSGGGVMIYAAYKTASGMHQWEHFQAIPMSDTDKELSRHWERSTKIEQIFITTTGAGPICIGGVNITTPVGYMVFSGNLGKVCKVATYESVTNVLPDTQNEPACTWIDGDTWDSNPRLPGIRLSMDGQYNRPESIKANEDLCKYPFLYAPRPLQRKTRQAPTDTKTYDFPTWVVKSQLEHSSAKRLCQGEYTQGPHFVSLREKLYCDMQTRELHPVCEPETTGVCFDVVMNELVSIGYASDHVVKSATRLKKYERVEVWS